ncbi:magnesium chelatase family protein [Inmirania thermothiophila]|uniref:Magnesium chelatase family protein n=1 Tax=Inmirania thermothiophila TaxID=1750597 RepID=A0A3N1Y6H9_9GAMM|nr:magnesium chelatase family protein [Inmirania thermothiophila]
MVHSRAQEGVAAPEVVVEVHLGAGLPALTLVGLPEAAVREAKDRVRSALVSAGFDFPARRITINLAPADLPKEGGRFDLPIAVGILAASGQVPAEALDGHELIGELALTGALRPCRGVLPAALAARRAGRALVVPEGNAAEAAAAGGRVLGAGHLLAVCAHLAGREPLAPAAAPERGGVGAVPDLADVRGQHQARRALEVAAAGGHSLLLIGPPGTGKSMLAQRLPGILPPMTEEEALEAAAVASAAGCFDPARWGLRPFRAPHHTASAVALVGGGGQPRPGEVSLAHHGVLFLDELPEFDRRVLEALREPLENGSITVSRAARQAEFPARFQLVAAMNPCPCGHLGDPAGRCRCTEEQVRRYRARISGPLLDRIDLHVEVPRLPREELLAGRPGEDSAAVRARVAAARGRQLARQGRANAALDAAGVERHCRAAPQAAALLAAAIERLRLSARAYHRILRVARTIADLAGAETIAPEHVAEAVGYRRLDRRLA